MLSYVYLYLYWLSLDSQKKMDSFRSNVYKWLSFHAFVVS